MGQRLPTFRLRTLLVVITIACVCLAVRQRMHHYQLFAHEHHYLALKAGYSAIGIQGSSFDRFTMKTVYPQWVQSVRHSQLADYYMQVTVKPWIMLLPIPAFPALPKLPEDDTELQVWWQQNVAQHIKNNGLDCNWGSYSDGAVSQRNLALLNARPSSFNRFLALSHPELFTEQPELLSEN